MELVRIRPADLERLRVWSSDEDRSMPAILAASLDLYAAAKSKGELPPVDEAEPKPRVKPAKPKSGCKHRWKSLGYMTICDECGVKR